MSRFRNRGRSKKKQISTKYLLFGMTFLCVILIIVGLTLNISGGPLNSIAGYLFVPMQRGINHAGNNISTRMNDFRTLSEVLEENAKLKEQVDSLTTELTTLKLERYELENYRELFALDEKYPSYEKIAASVIAKDASNWFDTFTVDRGKKDGVEVGMNVIAGSGLVGIVTDVGPNYAKIRSIIDDSCKVSAMVTSSQDNIIVNGNLTTMNTNGTITFNGLKDEAGSVFVGDQVVTSYVSDQYKQGILIGYIASIESDSNNLTKSGTITPIVDFEHIEEVLIIKDIKNIDKLYEMQGEETLQ